MRAAPVPVITTAAPAPPGTATYSQADALRTDPRSANPADWRVDWADGPWPVTVLDGGVRRPLDGTAGDPDLAPLARLLFHTFAVSRLRVDPRGGLAAAPGRAATPGHGPRVVLRRPVPSGGSMYPTEAYVVCTRVLGGGAHHYDPYRHELTDLGRPDAPARLAAALGAADLPAVTLVLTNRFWKNFYKYGDFAFRLGAVDVGVALGRVLRLAAELWGPPLLWTAFADDRVDAALGVDGRDEGAYAVVGLAAPEAGTGTPRSPGAAPPVPLERSRRIKRSARFDALHAAARAPAAPPPAAPAPVLPGPVTPLPPPDAVRPSPADMLRRSCAGALFDGRPAPAPALAIVLHHAAAVLDGRAPAGAAGLALYVAVHRVTGVPAGWYRYRPAPRDLVGVGAGTAADTGRVLQEGLFAASLNIELAAFTVHVSAPVDERAAAAGVRGYRDQQLAVGMAVEAVTLLAETAGLSGHPVLGFDVHRVDRAYGLTGGPDGIQAQVSVGSARPGLNWEVSVLPR